MPATHDDVPRRAGRAARGMGAPGGSVPRVAFFTDSYHEANGVALTSRQFAGFAKTQYYPFLSIHTGPETAYWKRGNFETYELASSHATLSLEHDLFFDLRFLRHRSAVRRAVAAFRPDLIHVTGPGHIGLLGAVVAHDLKIPLAASWHTNVHEFGGRRLRKLLGQMPHWLAGSWTPAVANVVERGALGLVLQFYKRAKLLFAPNPELVEMLEKATSRPVHLMQRGIDTNFFTPGRRADMNRDVVTIGYVGRLSAEKNVRELAEVEAELQRRGVTGFRFLIVGEGSERAWLRENMRGEVELPGLLRGDPLADAYASMDMFLFPSETDTFGNVILEALASGLPALVGDQGGPKFLVKEGKTGFVCSDTNAFAKAAEALIRDRQRLAVMREKARQASLARSWSTVFQGIYEQYRYALASGALPRVNHPNAETRAGGATSTVARAI